MGRSDKRLLTFCSAATAVLAGFAARPLLERFYVNFGIKAEEAAEQAAAWPVILATALLGAFVGILIGRGLLHVRDRWAAMSVGDRVTFFVSVFGGLIASVPLITLANAAGPYQPLLILGIVLGTIGLSIYALQSMEEVLPWNRGGFRGKRRGIKVLDTNVIIDGRIRDVARSGFIEGQLYVPGFVLDELQHIATAPIPCGASAGGAAWTCCTCCRASSLWRYASTTASRRTRRSRWTRAWFASPGRWAQTSSPTISTSTAWPSCRT